MANFNVAYEKTVGFEGGYSNDPDDFGKETYKGVSRRYFPSWRGWFIVDDYKDQFPNDKEKFNSRLKDSVDLENAVKEFYLANFWDINLLDEFESQDLANEVFDTGVNLGYKDAALFLQTALNVLNKRGKIYKDVDIDGDIGAKTLEAMKACIAYRGDESLYKVLNILQGYHYVNRMMENDTQEKFAYGWLNRVEFK